MMYNVSLPQLWTLRYRIRNVSNIVQNFHISRHSVPRMTAVFASGPERNAEILNGGEVQDFQIFQSFFS
jgi:hypothetical protein